MTTPITIRQLMESGVHFGHRSSRWNPKMKPFIFMKRNVVHIIDLRQTIRSIHVATTFLERVTSKGGEALFVGTKRQARNVILSQARRSNMHYVTVRWLGGTLTNFSVIRNRMKRLEYLEELEKSEKIRYFSKKIQASIHRMKLKMLRNLEGIRKMTRLPNVLIIVDPGREKNALQEARRLGIPTIAIIDTDCDPDLVDIPIPSNDDAMRSIAIIMERLGDAVLRGVEKYKAHVGPIADQAGPGPREARPVRRRPQGRDKGRGGTRFPQRGPGRGPGGPGHAKGKTEPRPKETPPPAPAPKAETPRAPAEGATPSPPPPPPAAPPEEKKPESTPEKPPEAPASPPSPEGESPPAGADAGGADPKAE
ncbi:MAG: 30S ribosomal protein S2 [Planctomycetota bacterium]|jgi:small subunit ribosomal protein S2